MPSSDAAPEQTPSETAPPRPSSTQPPSAEAHLAQIAANAPHLHQHPHMLDAYASVFNQIAKEIEPEQISALISTPQPTSDHTPAPNSVLPLLALYVAALFHKRRLSEIRTALAPIDLTGANRHADFFTSKLLKYHYFAIKHTGQDATELYKLLVSNREYGNTHSVAVLRNCILDWQINKNIYCTSTALLPDEPAALVSGAGEEAAQYAFYLGFIALVRGEYKEAAAHLSQADILTRRPAVQLRVRKCLIICRLLLGDYAIAYPYTAALRPYFALIGALRRGDGEGFGAVLEEYRGEFFGMNLYFVVRRLTRNLLLEGLRKVAVSYSRISVSDISRLLGMDVEYLLALALASGAVRGRVEGGIFYGNMRTRAQAPMGAAVREAVQLREAVGMLTRYPEIPALTYEYVLAQEAQAEQ